MLKPIDKPLAIAALLGMLALTCGLLDFMHRYGEFGQMATLVFFLFLMGNILVLAFHLRNRS